MYRAWPPFNPFTAYCAVARNISCGLIKARASADLGTIPRRLGSDDDVLVLLKEEFEVLTIAATLISR
jgi:hypothetical protein